VTDGVDVVFQTTKGAESYANNALHFTSLRAESEGTRSHERRLHDQEATGDMFWFNNHKKGVQNEAVDDSCIASGGRCIAVATHFL